jgi:hypothetical protein
MGLNPAFNKRKPIDLPRAVAHPADDAAQHPLPEHRLPHGLPALARCGRAPGRPGVAVGAAGLQRRRPGQPARSRGASPVAQRGAAVPPPGRRAHRQRDAGRAGLPAGPRQHAGAPHQLARLPARGAALRAGGRWHPRSGGRGRSLGLGLRHAGRAGSRAPPGHALPQRPDGRGARGARPALRVRALRRAAGRQPAALRPPGRTRWPPPRPRSTAGCAS